MLYLPLIIKAGFLSACVCGIFGRLIFLSYWRPSLSYGMHTYPRILLTMMPTARSLTTHGDEESAPITTEGHEGGVGSLCTNCHE